MILFDVSDPSRVRQLDRVPDQTWGVLSPDGKVVASFPVKDKAYLGSVDLFDWDGKKLKPRGTSIPDVLDFNWNLARPESYLTFLADGRLGVCHKDGRFRVWDVSEAEPRFTVAAEKHEGVGYGYWPVASPDGKAVAVWSEGQVVVLRVEGDLPQRSRLWRESPGIDHSHIQSVAWRTNDTLVVGHLNGAVTQWDVTKNPAVQIDPVLGGIHRGSVFEVSTDGSTLVAVGENGRIQRFAFGQSKPTPAPLREDLSLFSNGPVSISPDGSVICFQGRAVRPADRGPDWREYLAELKPEGARTLFAPDGRHILHWTGTKAAVAPFSDDLSRGMSEWIALPPNADLVPFLVPGGRHFLTWDRDGKVGLYSRDGDKINRTHEVTPGPNFRGSAAATPDGKTLALLGGEVHWFSLDSNKLKPINKPFTYWNLDGSTGACFSPDNRLVAFIGDHVRVFDRETGEMRHDWKWPSWPFAPRRALFAPDCRHLLVHNLDGTLYVLRLPAS
jgi:WD40 repeat protein